MNGEEDTRLGWREIEQLASRRASKQAETARWNMNTVILAYAVLAVTLLLGQGGFGILIVAPVTIIGLSIVWFIAWRRGKKLDSSRERCCQPPEGYLL